MQSKWFKYGTLAMLVVAVLAAAHLAFWQRYMVEKDFRQVELALNYDEISSLAGLQGLTPVQALQRFKEHGITTVVLRESMLDDLTVSSDIQVYSGQALLNRQRAGSAPAWLPGLSARTAINKKNTYLVMFDRDLFNQVSYQMSAKLTGVKSYEIGSDTYVIETVKPYVSMKDLGVGFTKSSLQDVQAAGMRTVLQIRSWDRASQQSIKKVFASYRNIPNLSAVMFNDPNIVGFQPGMPSLLPEVAYQIRQLNVPVAQIEFFPQQGLTKLGILLDKNVVRLHTIDQKEIKAGITPGEALDRYALAAAERDHRILLIRPFLMSNDPIEYNLGFMDSLVSRLHSEGLQVGPAGKLPPIPSSHWVLFLIGLGVIAGGLRLLDKLGLSRLVPLAAAAAPVIWAGLLYFDLALARKLMALAAVIIFPTLSLITNVRREGLAPGQAVLAFIRISLFSLLGALFMVGLLADAGFMLKLDQFMGVKLAHVLPLLIVLVYFALLAAQGEGVAAKVKSLWNHPLRLGIVLAAGVMAVVVAVYVARTGNEAMTVSSTEMQFRTLLDHLLGVRPRTKEFLLGHPALMLLLIYGYRDNRFLPLLLLGTIGQASLVNTFAHIHTPLVVSLLRAFHGLWLGILLGLALFLVIRLTLRRGRGYLNG
ncbi:DUF5693 family protein [Desulfotomaculum nigrificans]|uniref:DUF5693 family protein n=1 Tax=Desulfotomaculum nigrificans TaxID=1565 RepID=UPI0001FAE691|nr:DUF5693 family protein [Desulfotomaculum nigrificans]